MNHREVRATAALYAWLTKIHEHQQNGHFADSLEIANRALDSEELRSRGKADHAKSQFRYHKAVALDMTGQHDEALRIIMDLVSEHPGTPEFESSLGVALHRLTERARQLIAAHPLDPEIARIHAVLERHEGAPYWLTHAVALAEATSGQAEAAQDRMRALLALSPNDRDYLACALSVAKAGELLGEVSRLRAKVRALLEERPYRFELAELLVESEQVPASS